MCSSKQIKELAECNAIYEFEKTVNMYGKEYIRYYYNKLAELNGSINSTCNCQHNSNSRDSGPCCGCDSGHTNADRIRNMSDEELVDFICSIETYEEGSIKTIENGVPMHTVTEVREWLQSEMKVKESEEK